jgi:mRNA interferase RelE/StbE
VKRIHFEPEVPAQVRAIPQHIAMTILEAIHRYAETGAGRVKPLSGEFEGFLRLRVGNHRVFFKETADTVTIHRVRNRKEAYR